MRDTLPHAFKLEPDGGLLFVSGRDAWALSELVEAGPAGVTPIDNPAPRWSAYVFNLRQLGLVIETIHESHAGRFPGHHARYVLHSAVKPLERRHGAAA